jgi:hypothetical protein
VYTIYIKKLLIMSKCLFQVSILGSKCVNLSSNRKTHKCLLNKSLLHSPKNKILYPKKHKNMLPPPHSFSSDVLLHDLSYFDIFTLSVWKNLLMFQLPSMLMYRAMRFSLQQMSYFLLFNALLKCIVDMTMLT